MKELTIKSKQRIRRVIGRKDAKGIVKLYIPCKNTNCSWWVQAMLIFLGCLLFEKCNVYICFMLKADEIISVNPEVLGNQPVFKGTRVTIESLFDYLESGETMDQFIDDFPSVSKDQAIAVIEIASKLMSSKNIIKLYETAA